LIKPKKEGKMKKVLFLMVVALVCFGWSKAYADYLFTFGANDGTYSVQGTLTTPSNGNGLLIVSGGTVTGTGTDNSGVSYVLLTTPPSGHLFGGTDLIFDNQLTPGSNPVLDGNGLVFEAKDGSSYINIWGNGPSSYTLFYLSATSYGPAPYGTVTIAPAPVPIPAALLLFGPGLFGLAAMRRRLTK
jgi:hypothetical protein